MPAFAGMTLLMHLEPRAVIPAQAGIQQRRCKWVVAPFGRQSSEILKLTHYSKGFLFVGQVRSNEVEVLRSERTRVSIE